MSYIPADMQFYLSRNHERFTGETDPILYSDFEALVFYYEKINNVFYRSSKKGEFTFEPPESIVDVRTRHLGLFDDFIEYIEPHRIIKRIPRDNPRETLWYNNRLRVLEASIREYGILTPIIAARIHHYPLAAMQGMPGTQYFIMQGQHRATIAKLIGIAAPAWVLLPTSDL